MRLNRKTSGGFTLMELMVAVGILTFILVGVGSIFQSASRAVSLSQVTLETFAGVNALQQQIKYDVEGIDASDAGNGLLVIRGRWRGDVFDKVNDLNKDYEVGDHVVFDAGGGDIQGYECIQAGKGSTLPDPAYWKVSEDRWDQIAFLSKKMYENPTGVNDKDRPFMGVVDPLPARVWYGHLYVRADEAGVSDQSMVLAGTTGPRSADGLNKDKDMLLGRHVTLLGVAKELWQPPTKTDLPSYGTKGNITSDYQNAKIYTGISIDEDLVRIPQSLDEQTPAHITSGRIAVSQRTPLDVVEGMKKMWVSSGPGADKYRGEADSLCYRFRTLPNAYASLVTGANDSVPLVNGVIRMHPALLKGVGSFAVDWTDGDVYKLGDKVYVRGNYQSGKQLVDDKDPLLGTLKWYGPEMFARPRVGNNDVRDPDGGNSEVERATEPTLITKVNGTDVVADHYTATFSRAIGAQVGAQVWPKALRFTYRVTDAEDRLKGGRTFVQIVALPKQ